MQKSADALKTIDNKVILLVLDGWGDRDEKAHNAVKIANPVNYTKLLENDPHMLLGASGESVGLPEGQMGNSEVGHTNLGAGRVVYQDLLRISNAFNTDEAGGISVLNGFLKKAKAGSARVHLLGLMSDGGVHSHINHFKGLISLAHAAGIGEIYVHPFMDGRDTPPSSGLGYIEELESWMNDNAGAIADICGRFYAMDRDKRWDRVGRAYDMLRYRNADKASSASEAVKRSYAAGITDEFIKPAVIDGVNGEIRDGDSIIFVNFRADRMREIMSAFYKEDFDGFDRGSKPATAILTMTEYDETMPADVIFPSENLEMQLGQIVSLAGLRQLRIAETEKYAHVTFFFNGGQEEPFEGEERILVPSPREVATYDLKPEMSVQEVAAKFEERFLKGDIDLVVMNFANPDMVGHTGVEEAAVKACGYVDEMLGKVAEVADKTGAVLIVTADHGNCEEMWDYGHDQPHTSHTTNPVNFIVHNYPCRLKNIQGKLADVAPTVLKIMGLEQPSEMTGICLID